MSHTPAAHTADRSSPEAASNRTFWAWAALVVAVAGLAGSLSLSWGLKLKACPLCFYQRAFMMGVVAVLGNGLLTGAASPNRLALLTFPVAFAGLGVAVFHVYLEAKALLECPPGLLGLGSAPQQSLAAFLTLSALLLGGAVAGRTPGRRPWAALAGASTLGVLLAAASCTSNPPMPPAPTEPYANPPDVCRPPYAPTPGT